jgi:hypothetical protein
VPKSVFASLYDKLVEFLLRLSGSGGFERHPLDRFAPAIVFDSDAGNEAAVPFPKAPNWVLAIVQDFGVSVSG